MKAFGTISRGVKAPIIKKGDNLVEIVTTSVINACKENNVTLQNKDIVAVTEAVLAKSQGNFATLDQIAKDVHNKFGNETVGLILPITSRNRFSMILKGISKGVKKLIIQLSYPNDEVGNPLISEEKLLTSKVNPYTDILTEEEFIKEFGEPRHLFTGMNYIKLYKELCECECEIILANNPLAILNYTKYVINADIHTRKRTKALLLNSGAIKVHSLDEILNKSIDGSGFHEEYGLLGSNMSKEGTIKLFPRDAQKFANELQKSFKEKTGKTIECMVYGDGAFKDPIGGIWELADPVVSPGFTSGLIGTPNEIKFKYIADNKLQGLNKEEADKKMKEIIKSKEKNLVAQNTSLGTTPRRYTDLLGSLSDLTSGSGDKGTPIVLIQNYFDTYAD